MSQDKIKTISEAPKPDKNNNTYYLIETEGGIKASVFSFHSLHGKLSVGDEVVLSQNGSYWNVEDPARESTGSKGGSSVRKQEAIDKSMDRKEGSIKQFQTDKEYGMRVFSTMRDSVLISIRLDNKTDKEMEESVIKWRRWLWAHLDDPKDFPPF